MGSPSRRGYDNRLREKRAEATRGQILDAVCEELSDGTLTELSVARIATRAGVSEPTVYRHFPNREAMFDALEAHVRAKLDVPELPADPDALAPFVERLFAAFDAERELVRGLMVARLGTEWNAAQRRKRTERLSPAFERIGEGLAESDARAALAVLRYLQSARAWKAFADEFGMEGRDAGAACAWATRVLLAEVARMKAKQSAARAKASLRRKSK